MWFITIPMPTGIDENELLVSSQRLDITILIPTLHVGGESMQQHKGWPFSVDLVMDTNPLVIRVWHTFSSYRKY